MTKPFSITLPQKSTSQSIGFEKDSKYICNTSFTFNNYNFHQGEILDVVGSRRFGPMAALEVIFRNAASGEKKFWVLHHDRHVYRQTQFTKLS